MSVVTSTLAQYNTQLRNNRLGLWLFFISEIFIFGGLLMTPHGPQTKHPRRCWKVSHSREPDWHQLDSGSDR